jgi:hypothetical protein
VMSVKLFSAFAEWNVQAMIPSDSSVMNGRCACWEMGLDDCGWSGCCGLGWLRRRALSYVHGVPSSSRITLGRDSRCKRLMDLASMLIVYTSRDSCSRFAIPILSAERRTKDLNLDPVIVWDDLVKHQRRTEARTPIISPVLQSHTTKTSIPESANRQASIGPLI